MAECITAEDIIVSFPRKPTIGKRSLGIDLLTI